MTGFSVGLHKDALSLNTYCLMMTNMSLLWYLINFIIWLIFFHSFTAVLDLILSWKARRSMSFFVRLRYVLKAVSAAAWVIVLPVTYAYSWKNPPGFARMIRNWFGNGPSSSSLFILAVVIYLSPNMLSALLFMFPIVRRFLERSHLRVVMLMMWWSQVLICTL